MDNNEMMSTEDVLKATEITDDKDLEELESKLEEQDGFTEEEKRTIELLSDCILSMASGSHIGIFLTEERVVNKQPVKQNTVLERVSLSCQPKIEFANGWVRLTLFFENNMDIDLKQFKYMWEEYWKRNTEAYLNRKENVEIHYHYEIQSSGVLEDKTYIMYFRDPVFGESTENGLVFTLPEESVFYTSSDIDYKEVDKEIEYETRTGEYSDEE